MKEIFNTEKKLEKKSLFFKMFKLEKGYLLLISDVEKMGIGNVTMGIHSTVKGLNATSSSYKLFGMDDSLLDTAIAEKASKKLQAPVLLLLYIQKDEENNKEMVKEIISCLNELLESYIKQRQ